MDRTPAGDQTSAADIRDPKSVLWGTRIMVAQMFQVYDLIYF